MRMEVVPCTALGPVALGASRTATRALLGGPSGSFRRAAWGERPSDSHIERGLILNFGRGDLLGEIEAFGACRPVLDGVDFLGVPRDQVLAAIRERGLELRESLGSWSVPAWGLSLFAQRSSDTVFTSVTLHAHGCPEEPVFFEAAADVDRDGFRAIDARGFPGARLGMPVADIREVLGEGMSAELPGRGRIDIFFSPSVAVFYADDGLVRRICAMQKDVSAVDGLVAVGMARATCRDNLRAAGVEVVETEGEILVARDGVSVNFSGCGNDSLPVSSISTT